MSGPRIGWGTVFFVAWRLRHGRPGRLILAVAGPLLASLGLLLAATLTRSSTLVVQASVAALRPAPYDILVRPEQDVSGAERQLGLLAPDELRWGTGISLAQWRAIARLPDVDVAAPEAPAGVLPARSGDWCPAAGRPCGRAVAAGSVTVVGIDPRAEDRLVGLAQALRYGSLLPARPGPHDWLVPPLLLAARWPATMPCTAAIGGSCPAPIEASGGLTQLPRLGYSTAPASSDTPALAQRRLDLLPVLPATATAWLSTMASGGMLRGGVDVDRLALGDRAEQPLPFALYGQQPAPAGPVLLADVEALCRLLGDGCISAVRVRVLGPAGLNDRRAAVIARVARAIAGLPGLRAEVTYGSSARLVRVTAPGTSRLERWAALEATLAVGRGVNAANLLLFALIGATALLYAMAGGLVAALQRGQDFEIMYNHGWTAAALRRLVVADSVLVEGLSCVLALVLGVTWIRAAGAAVPLEVIWTLPLLAVALGVAGAVAGNRLARAGQPKPTTKPGHALPAGARRGWLPWWLALAARNLGRRPARAALVAGAAGVTAALFTLLALGLTALRGLLAATVLGRQVALELGPYHTAMAAIAAALAILVVADLGTQTIGERRPEIGLLRAVGWPRTAVGRVVLAEACLAGSVGAGAGGMGAGLLAARIYGVDLGASNTLLTLLGSIGLAIAIGTLGGMPALLVAVAVAPAEAQAGG